MEAQMSSLPCVQLCRRFSLDEILLATQNFNDALVVGEGGFGKVYKATINIENGATFIAAIKRLASISNQGAPEFWAEIEMLTKLRHCNLVSLIGYCNDNSEMILIYEFMPNGTLDDHLHRDGTCLSWVQRLKISIGAARGLHYLHSGTGTKHGVIHRDVKSTNILLDEDFAAKISDFGLSKISSTDTSGAYVKTIVRGTFGYLDPEYFLTERLTSKSDVFAFGVVLFELLCGRVAVDRNLDDDECSLVKWAHESIEKGKVHEIIDINIKSQIYPKCLKVYVQIADRCLSTESKKRPTMAEILAALELCLTLQNKHDSHVKPATGVFSVSRMIKWPFISTEANPAQSDGKLSTVIEDITEDTSSSKEDRLNHVPDQTKSHDEENINNASTSKEHCHDLKEFSLYDLKTATRGFRSDMKLGEGEFGEVFEGWIDTNTSSMSVDGPIRVAIRIFRGQYYMEAKFVDILREFNHPNLVKVLGYCFEDDKVYLVYEFMENGSLDSHMFKEDKIPLSWKTRVQIAKGVAEALSFLLETQPDVQNHPLELHHILLDKNFNAKISGFESARLVYGDSYIHINDDPLYYYLSPPGNSLYKGIIRPFGIVLTHILTGESNSEIGISKLRRTNQAGTYRKEIVKKALDPRLPNVDRDIDIKEAIKLTDVALRCVEKIHQITMNEILDVVRLLKTKYWMW